MRSYAKFIAMLIAAMVISITGIAPASAATVQLSGRVTDQAANPIAGAMVAVIDPATSGTVASATTDTSGNYTVSVGTGTYNITVTPSPGSSFQPATLSNKVITGDLVLDFDLVPVIPTVILSGRITDAAGNGVPNQSVTATAVMNPPSPLGQTFSAPTDVTGHYTVQVPTGNYTVRASGNSRVMPGDGTTSPNVPQSWNINLTAPLAITRDTTLDFPLPVKQVGFHIQDPTGAPVANASVTTGFSSPTPSPITIGGFAATASSRIDGVIAPPPTTNATGDASALLFPGTYTFTAAPPAGSPLAGFTLTNAVIATNQTLAIALQYVHAAPVTTATVSPALTNGTTTDPAAVTLSAAAATGFTVASTTYTVDGGTKQTYSASFAVTGSGAHTVVYSSADNVGVAETAKTLQFAIVSDSVPPTTTASLNGAAGNAPWYKSTVTVTLSATDNTGDSGVASTYYILDTGAQQTYSVPFSVSGDGAHTVTFWSVDKANNVELHKQQSISIDATAPTGVVGTPERAPDSNGWYNHPVKVTFGGTDPISGIASCTSTTYTGPDAGTASLAGTCTDNAGNVSMPATFTFKYDGTKPTGVTGTPDRAPDSNGWYNHAVKVTFSTADTSVSEIASCTSTTYSGPDSGAATATGICTDTAGNASDPIVFTFKYDATKPTVTYTGNVGTYTADQTVSITCTAADATSGIASATCQNVTGPAYSFIVGANPYSATATDKAGNTGTGATSFTVTASAGSVSNVVSQFVTNGGQANSLITKLQHGNIDAFINEVNAQTGKALTPAQAQTLIKLANALR